MKYRYRTWCFRPQMIIGLALVLGACAGPAPTQEMRAAGDAIARAQADGADHLAPQSLQLAQQKLAQAQTEVTNENNEGAARLAEQAEVDADYADASANAQRTTNTANELTGAQQRLQQRLRQQP